MKNLLDKVWNFIRENPSLIYSLLLIILIPAAFFINTYSITENFENNIDSITQRNAVMTENIIKNIADRELENQSELQRTLENIAEENKNLSPISITVMKPGNNDNFIVLASTDSSILNQETSNIQDTLAWKAPEGIAYLSENNDGRFWRVTKAFNDLSGEKTALISMSYSLANTDQIISDTINRAYVILVITILVVILLTSNQVRLFGYALTLQKLKEIDNMKDMFISMASHELRTPLTTIQGYIDLLKDKKEITSDSETHHYVENMSASVNRLKELVSDVLEVSRLEGNRLPIEITTFDPNPAISQSVEEIRQQATQKGLALNYQPANEPLKIKADENRLKQVLVNIAGNSVKYTPKGKVDITTTVKNNEFIITVADTGIGISAEDQANLFQKFYRVKNEKTKDIIGTGLGLWITLELVRKMGGKIVVESIEGVGTHFYVHLPLSKE